MAPLSAPRRQLALALPLLAAAAACDGEPASGGSPPVQPPAVIAEYLDSHNAVRAGASPAPVPALLPLTWSSAAASAAWSWASLCQWGHDPSLGSLGMGQNLAAGRPPGAYSITAFVNLWAAEAADYDYAGNTCSAGAVCGHYTQIVWRATTSLGCVLHTCTGGTPPPGWTADWDYLVCNYAPPGNVSGQRPY
ncbi:MAG TPA: CAP domain-containing protein [Anaeromyxobacteraceae bacterium]|nr:CAP domain-containing protein [Anaeromyxobacteraceae bacterium]